MILTDKNKANSLAILTGVTAIFGGIEPAAAALISTTPAHFSLSTSDSESNSASISSDLITLSSTSSQTKGIAQFDNLGGTRILEGVELVFDNNSEAGAAASAAFTCTDPLGRAVLTCVLNSSNLNLNYSALLDFGSGTHPLFAYDNPLRLSATCKDVSCTASASDSRLGISPLDTLTYDITDPALLADFVGTGTFGLTATLAASGRVFASSDADSQLTDFSASIDGYGNPSARVNYTYSTVEVPEPLSLLLFTTGLAGIGLSRRQKK